MCKTPCFMLLVYLLLCLALYVLAITLSGNLMWMGFPSGSAIKNLPAVQETTCNPGQEDPWSGRSPERANSNPLQYSWLGNPMVRGTWWATVHGISRAKHNLEIKPPRGRAILYLVMYVWGAISRWKVCVSFCLVIFAEDMFLVVPDVYAYVFTDLWVRYCQRSVDVCVVLRDGCVLHCV